MGWIPTPVLAALGGYLFTYYNTRITEERKARIERVNDQVSSVQWLLCCLSGYCVALSMECALYGRSSQVRSAPGNYKLSGGVVALAKHQLFRLDFGQPLSRTQRSTAGRTVRVC